MCYFFNNLTALTRKESVPNTRGVPTHITAECLLRRSRIRRGKLLCVTSAFYVVGELVRVTSNTYFTVQKS